MVLLRCDGGEIVLPAAGALLVSREDGGHLIVEPPRPVWERSELRASELAQWGALVAATGRAMIDTLPCLRDGCVNYWEAGNWSLHDEAPPPGRKEPRDHRRVHAHVLGRSRTARHPSWQWGEAPQFPRFADRRHWSAAFAPLDAGECRLIVEHAARTLRDGYGLATAGIHYGPQ